MAAEITSISPGRARAGDTISLMGAGFSPTAAQNTVTVDGVPATVTLDSEPQVDVTVPVGVSAGPPHVQVVLVNLDDGSAFTWWVWIKPSAAAISTADLPFKRPFRDEVDLGPLATAENPGLALSKSFERIVAALELLDRDIVSTKGALATMAGAGLRQATPGAIGEYLGTFSGGARFGTRAPLSLHWGRLLLAANDSDTLLEAGGTDGVSAVTATEEVATADGTLVLWQVFASNGSFSNRVNVVSLLVNGSVVDTHDIDAEDGVGLGPGDQRTFKVSVSLLAGDVVEVRVAKVNTSAAVGVRAMAQVV